MHRNTKVDSKNTQLFELFKETTNWHKARIKCLLVIINSMIQFHSVSYIKLAQGLSSAVEYESSLRRVQRFFAEFAFDPLIFTRLIYSLLPDEPPYQLSMDRTNWKFGKTDINILMLSVCYKGVAIPLIWKLLPKRGNSNVSRSFSTATINSEFSEYNGGFIGETNKANISDC